MSLVGRVSAFVLATVGVVLMGFSATLYLAARASMHRLVDDRLTAALAVLAAAAEIHPHGVEWEPHERALELGQEPGGDQFRWVVEDQRGNRIDQSRHLGSLRLAPDSKSRNASASRQVRGDGRSWLAARRVLRPGHGQASGSEAGARTGRLGAGEPEESFQEGLVLTAFAPLGPTEAALGRLGASLVGLALGTGALVGLTCHRLVRRALRPLTAMAASARDLDASDPGWCLELPGTCDELEALGRSFNELLARLHVAYDRQRRFGGDASHQLRTPLTVLTGQLEVALRRDRPVEEYRRVLRLALDQAHRLGGIVESLLFLARADAGLQQPRGEPLELDHWVAGHLDERSPTVAVSRGGSGPIWVRAQPALLAQALDNLLDNARKYGRPESSARIEISREGTEAVLAVEDDGPGIAPGDLPCLFEPFFRAESARRRGESGVGLGLAIVRRIAEVSGGRASVRSESGRGSRFELRLPAIDAHEPCPAGVGDLAESESLR